MDLSNVSMGIFGMPMTTMDIDNTLKYPNCRKYMVEISD